ncbi:uncharacterized protein LOC126598911 [Malus sylvestris]|uniref:uncharacterized protein LOC126598911 n=1 Tax=Malus sylvestris TaxID=3752 RepID=UPI0021AC8D4E|nr:uncharacterized protein LOC126598911 [Malus sylvestris]
MDAMFTCVENFLPDNYEVQNQVINIEMSKYKKREGGFGRHLAEIGCIKNDDNYDPVSWWSTYGNRVPNLQRIAIKILSLTTSSSGCERNWSTFEGIHTKKRNRLDTTMLNNLVYVQSNAKIMTKKEKENGKKMDILLASEASMAQGWIVEGGDEEVELDLGMDGEALDVDSSLDPRRSSRNVEVRELHEEDFVSDEDMEEEGDVRKLSLSWRESSRDMERKRLRPNFATLQVSYIITHFLFLSFCILCVFELQTY